MERARVKRPVRPVIATALPLAVAAFAVLAPACATAPAGGGAASASSEAPAAPAPVAADTAAGRARRGYTAADVRFLQRMIPHHAQALAMTALVPARAAREDLRPLAERIALSQETEIAQMRRWLESRGEAVAEPGGGGHGAHAHHGAAGGEASMPGMLTDEEMRRLAAASGAEFDRLFLEYMIRHHEGALAMVAELFRTPNAAQETELFSLASDVDADQRAEIRRLRALQQSLTVRPAGP